MKLLNSLVIGLLLVTCLFACKKKKDDGPDTTKPQVTVDEPTAGQQYSEGSILKLTASFSDDRALKECVAKLVRTGDAPGTVELKSATGIDDPWEPVNDTIPLNGTSDDVANRALFEPSIPASKPGVYKLTLEVRDAAENPNVTIQEITIELI
jgi:hypothetical protein